jgi:hypothetical protein
MASRNYSSVPGELGRRGSGSSYEVELVGVELDGVLGAGAAAGVLAVLSLEVVVDVFVSAGAAGFPGSDEASDLVAEGLLA